ncbi:MAG: hypothetical protein KJ592_00395 [Nanoarchaeota archaeon]|nr:hypothetical protein [Nanoarchaeota archaeon]
MNYTIANLEKDYEMELDKIVDFVGSRKSEVGSRKEFSVLLQLPDGLKPWGLAICDYLGEECGVEVRIYLGDCFGACDLPVRNLGFLPTSSSDCGLVVQFGHASWGRG